DIAIIFSKEIFESIDIAIIDEAQDLSANQIKAITNQLAEESFSTIVLDTNQRIYKRGFSWKEVGIDKPRFSRLELNYRNSYEIAYFASKLIENSSITFDDDGTLPLLQENKFRGEKPIIVNGYFNEQLNYVIRYLRNNIDLDNESIGFLHVKGGNWFSGIKDRLEKEGLGYDEITAQRNWPKNNHNIALSTIHSAKGLEFDYVFILGLEERLFNLASKGAQDSDYSPAIKLISMGITRAKKQVILGYKEESKPFFIDFFEKDSFIEA
ncbi:3'-5' exonuclease, partial [Marinomonas ostreistagni]